MFMKRNYSKTGVMNVAKETTVKVLWRVGRRGVTQVNFLNAGKNAAVKNCNWVNKGYDN